MRERLELHWAVPCLQSRHSTILISIPVSSHLRFQGDQTSRRRTRRLPCPSLFAGAIRIRYEALLVRVDRRYRGPEGTHPARCSLWEPALTCPRTPPLFIC